jgi:hypothetical protein
MLRRIAYVLIGLVVVMQFIRPSGNIGGASTNDIRSVLTVPQEVQEMLHTSCFDCHSNVTRYPWYWYVQPVGWWLNSHIQDAKRELNFSEFGDYRPRRQYIKLEQIVNEVSDDKMPLPSYPIIHTDAKLSQDQKAKLIAWANAARDSLKAKYPADSLERRKRN